MDGGPTDRADGWSETFDRHAPALTLFARQWTDSHADAEDVVQNVFVKVWKSGRLASAADPTAYLFASVKRAALDQRRASTRRARREAVAGQARRPDAAVFESTAERDEWRVEVESALGRLPEAQREVLVLKVWGELTFPQIGDVLGVSSNTAASRYRYALEALRRRLTEEAVP